MKKFFMLLVALVFTGATFAQTGNAIPLDEPIQTGLDRDFWHGYTGASSYFILEDQDMYALRVPAGEVAAGAQVTQVKFYHMFPVNDPAVQNSAYSIEIWEGGVYDTANSVLTPGTMVSSQNYTATEEGPQTVSLTNPYNVGTSEFWVCVRVVGGTQGVVLMGDTPDGVLTNELWPLLYTDAGVQAWNMYNFGSEEEGFFPKPWYLAFYVNDGQGYTETSDFYGEFYEYGDAEQYPDAVTSQLYQEGDDSLRVYFGIFNNGIDSATQDLTIDLYIVAPGENIYYWQGESLGISATDPCYANYGWRIGGNPDSPITLIGYDEMATAGLTFPFDVCMDLNYAGTDPDLTNNHICLQITDGVGINENNSNNLSVYPNPANNVINVMNAEGAQVTVFDINGKVVAEVEVAEANQAINVANLTQGLYIVRVANGNEVSTGKVSIVR